MQLRNRLIWLHSHIFCVSIFVLPILVLFVSRISNAIFFVLALIPCILFIRDNKWASLKQSPTNKIILLWLFFAFITLYWTLHPLKSSGLWLQMSLMYISTFALLHYTAFLEHKTIQRISYVAIIGIFIALACANIEIISNGLLSLSFRQITNNSLPFLLSDLNRGSVVIALLAWPIFGYFYLSERPKEKHIYSWLFFFLISFTVLRLESQSASAAILIGGFTWLFITFTRRIGAYLFIGAIAAFFIAFPLIMLHVDPDTIFNSFPMPSKAAAQYRLHIWHFTSQKAFLYPWAGWGFDASRYLPVGPEDFWGTRHPMPLHPHNNVLQVWLELGIIGLVLFFAFLTSLILHIIKFTHPKHVALSLALVAAYFMVGTTGYGIWQHWLIASGIIAMVLLCMVFKLRSSSNSIMPH